MIRGKSVASLVRNRRDAYKLAVQHWRNMSASVENSLCKTVPSLTVVKSRLIPRLSQ